MFTCTEILPLARRIAKTKAQALGVHPSELVAEILLTWMTYGMRAGFADREGLE